MILAKVYFKNGGRIYDFSFNKKEEAKAFERELIEKFSDQVLVGIMEIKTNVK